MKPYYEHAGITIYHGDCREVLQGLPVAFCRACREPLVDEAILAIHLAAKHDVGPFCDLVLTDPPYGIGMSKGFEGFEGFGGFGPPIPRRQYPDVWDKERPEAGTFADLLKICQSAIIWGGNFFADLLPRATHWLVWDKLNTMPSFGDCELAWTNFDRKSVKKLTVEWNGLIGKEEFRDHPTQKPVELMNLCLIKYALDSDGVLDPFMGSGTTLVAAKNNHKRAIGIEIEEKYCAIAAKRLEQEVFNFEGNAKGEISGEGEYEQRLLGVDGLPI